MVPRLTTGSVSNIKLIWFTGLNGTLPAFFTGTGILAGIADSNMKSSTVVSRFNIFDNLFFFDWFCSMICCRIFSNPGLREFT